MGKINYTLLNASALNASRLNMTGETGKPGGGAGGYWPAGTPAAIRRSAVLWYDIAKQGATNETMAANPVLKDLSGHGHDATCYNFGWTEESGISTTDYPGALVSDGVDDYAMVEGLPLLTREKGYTVVAKRKWLETDYNSYSKSFLNKRIGADDASGAFQVERMWNGRFRSFSFGSFTGIELSNDSIIYQTSKLYNENSLSIGEATDTSRMYIASIGSSLSSAIAFYSVLLFNRDLTAEEIEWTKNNLIENNHTVEELDASLVDAWIFSGYRNEDAPKSVTGEKGHALALGNFAYAEGSGFDGGCLVTDGMDDYGICADFPIKDTYTLIVKFATLDGYPYSAPCSMTYFDDSGARRNGVYPIYMLPGAPYGSMTGRKKYVSASSELAAVWINKEAFNGEAYDDTSGQYTPAEGRECTVYVGKLDDQNYYGVYKLAYWACYDKVMTQEEAEAEIAKLDALWEARKV